MKLLVCGGRDYSDRMAAFVALDAVHSKRPITAVIHGAAKGADLLAGQWAKQNGIHAMPFPADWNKDGRAAGPIRNARMLAEGKPDGVVAFPGGRGTADMIAQASKAGLKVWEPYK